MNSQNLFKSILNFMHSVDKNGDWNEAEIDEAEYILETIAEWIEDGLELTPRVEGYMEYLKQM